MRRPKPPLFYERQVYRRRRMADAARMLPVLGALLFLVPLLWGPQKTPETDTASGGLFLFVAWAGLILIAFVLSRRLGQGEGPAPPDEEGG